MAERKLKVHEIDNIRKISDGSMFTVLHKHFGMRKLFAKWVPRDLIIHQKQQRFDDSEQCLELFKRTASFGEEKSVVSSKQCVVSQVDENDDKIVWWSVSPLESASLRWRIGESSSVSTDTNG